MNLLDFFDKLKGKSLSPETKDLIFQRFEIKKRHQLRMKALRSFARVGVLGLGVFAVLGAMYFGSFSGDTGEWAMNEKDGYIGFNADETAPVVYADEIGTIITTVGEVTISNEGVQKSGSQLAHADKVLLLAGAELTFAMQGGVQAKIIGPAEFDLEKNGDQYVINMLEGEFVALKSVQEQETSISDRQFVEDEPNPIVKKLPKQTIQVVVKTADFEVSSDSAKGDIDMTITEKDGKQTIENVGVDVVITKLIKDEVVVTQLKSQEKADISEEVLVALITPDREINEDQADILAKNIKNNELTISYSLEDEPGVGEAVGEEGEEGEESPIPEETIPQPTQKTQPSDTLVAKADPVVSVPSQAALPAVVEALIDEDTQDESKSKEIEKEAPAILEAGKRVIGGGDLAALQNATNQSVIMRSMTNIVVSHAHGNAVGLQTSLANLAATLAPVSDTGVNSLSTTSMIGSINTMISSMEAKRYVPPVYTDRLKSVIAWLRLVQTVPSGSVENTCNFDCIVNDVLKIEAYQKSRLMLQ